MRKYDIIFESLQEKVLSGELTMEDAEILNDVAYEKYGQDETEYEAITESQEDEGMTYEEYLESMEEELFGEASKEETEHLIRRGMAIRGEDPKKSLNGMSEEDRKRNIKAGAGGRWKAEPGADELKFA